MAYPLYPPLTNIDPQHPDAVAQCDYSGQIVMHKDLCPQMEYSGKGLYFTGFWVHKDYLDLPNPQKLAPPIKQDPIPVRNPRPSPFLTESS
jgi:hypothetical protein